MAYYSLRGAFDCSVTHNRHMEFVLISCTCGDKHLRILYSWPCVWPPVLNLYVLVDVHACILRGMQGSIFAFGIGLLSHRRTLSMRGLFLYYS